MEAPKDKRTKAYKDWVKAQKEAETTGLGDVVEKVTKATGVKKLVGKVFDSLGKDCGCNKRKEDLNKIRLRFKLIRCFTQEHYEWYTEFKKANKTEVTRQEINKIKEIILHLFNRDIGKPKCCVNKYIKMIDQIYEKYQ